MKKTIVLIVAMLALSIAANATPNLVDWTGKLAFVVGSGPAPVTSWVDVVVNATDQGDGSWYWSYLVTPGGPIGEKARNIGAFTLYLGTDALSNFTLNPETSPNNDKGWAVDVTSDSISWTAGNAARLQESNPGTFWFYNRLAPYTYAIAAAQDGGQYNSMLPAPTVPEPMSILLGTLGLGAIGGFRKLRK